MASQVEIVNMALAKLGQPAITSLDENNTAARTMSTIYDIERKALLRQYRWGFAIARAQLAALTDDPAFGYDYQYQLPTDCLQLIRVYNQQDDPNYADYNTNPQRQYVIEGRKILINEEAPIYIIYVSDFEETGDFDPAFVKMFATALALEACERITQSNTKKQTLMADLQESKLLAVRSNAIQLPSEAVADTSWTTARL